LLIITGVENIRRAFLFFLRAPGVNVGYPADFLGEYEIRQQKNQRQ